MIQEDIQSSRARANADQNISLQVFPRSLASHASIGQGKINLARNPWVRPLLESRWPQLLARALTLAGFVFTIAAGLFGSQVGSHNFAIIFVWIAWWTALKLAFIPLGGRSWCSVCPIPMPGEWLQRGGLLENRAGKYGLNLRWPKRLRGGWLQWAGFLLIGLFSAVTLTTPSITSWALLGIFALATVMGVVFERRAFCTHVCPIGGFTGIYAKTAPVEVRVIDSSVCAAHAEKTCYTNCPWGLYPLALKDSAQCGLCMECLRVCPSDNIAVNIRAFGSDLPSGDLAGNQTTNRAATKSTPKLDEAFLALMMLGSALAFAAVFTGPWGALKAAAYAIGSQAWFAYAAAFLALNLLVLPGLFGLAVWAEEKINRTPGVKLNALPKREGLKKKLSAFAPWSFSSFASQSQALLPLGLCAWIAFTISFAFPKFNYVITVLSDPLGWGWDLFGTAASTWTPDSSTFGPALQAGTLLLGLFWSSRVAVNQNSEKSRAQDLPILLRSLPVMAFCLAFSAAMLWLLVG